MRVELLMAWPRRHEQRWVELPEGSRVADALAAAGWQDAAGIAGLALNGRRVDASTPLEAGDRVELLRALELDPKEARRRRASSGGGERTGKS
ncbi:RnfH family protein [Marilutibacter spongiae]|uniref:UPF0125 protein H4F98_01955 n=1 Tax=Marilutibacter spongiae TaxID=2025720 RepID=A0A7W3TJ85_9GAMM|nr:RnfH family protein [Lysobacter spongiae]